MIGQVVWWIYIYHLLQILFWVLLLKLLYLLIQYIVFSRKLGELVRKKLILGLKRLEFTDRLALNQIINSLGILTLRILKLMILFRELPYVFFHHFHIFYVFYGILRLSISLWSSFQIFLSEIANLLEVGNQRDSLLINFVVGDHRKFILEARKNSLNIMV